MIWNAYMERHGKDAQEIRSAEQTLRHLRTAFRLAKDLGEGLGRGSLLFRPLPQGEGQG